MPVLVNAFGSEARMAAALGVERLDELGERVAKLLDLRMPGTFAEQAAQARHPDRRRQGAAPRLRRSAPCQEIVETAAPSLAGLPILQCWPGDGGRYITLPVVFTRDPAHRRAQRRHVPPAGLRRSARSACTGRRTRAAPSTQHRADDAAACRWPSRSAAIPP